MINYFYKKNNRLHKKGSTLIELMVSVTIFAIVTVISMGAILTVVDGNKKNQTMQVAINNLNFAVESMTRSLKTGYGYVLHNISAADANCNNHVEFSNTDGELVEYFQKQFGSGNDNYGLYTTNGETDYEGFITSPDLNIIGLCFTKSTSDTQPALTIIINGETTNGKENLRTKFNIYTSVTQRQVQYDD